MNTSNSASDAMPAETQGVKGEIARDGTATAAHVPADPSMPVPGAEESGERICDAPSDPDKPAGVESVDKGA
jgi:hypothetical protein